MKKYIFSSGKSLGTRIFDGYIVLRGNKLPKPMIIGVVAVIFLYVGVAGMVSIKTPLGITSGDTRSHIDYVWRIYNHEIPKINDGIRYQPFNIAGNRKIQPQANHPPLFYALNAPFIGPLLADGHWERAIAAARLINVFLGVLCIAALAWAGWLYGGSRRELFAVALPAVAALAHRFTTLNVVYGADTLLVLIAILVFVILKKIIEHGTHTKYLAILTLLAVLGMATKATFIVILITIFVALILRLLVVPTVVRSREAKRTAIYLGVLIIIVVLSVGWFYVLRNYQTSGSLFRATQDNYSHGRAYKSLPEVLFSGKLRGLLYEEYAGNISLSIIVTTLAVAGFLGVKEFHPKKTIFQDKKRILTAAILLLPFLGMIAVQIAFATGYGAINFRYLLPALTPIGLFFAFGLLEYRWARGQLVALTSLLLAATTLLPTTTLIPDILMIKSGIQESYASSIKNGIPGVVVAALILFCVVGALLVSVSLYILTAKKSLGTKNVQKLKV